MSEEDTDSWIARYRSTVAEEPAAALDEIILRSAGRHAVRVRVLRRSIWIVGLAVLIVLPFWGVHVMREPEAEASTGYGHQEGTTRFYLMNVASYTGPGSLEHTP